MTQTLRRLLFLLVLLPQLAVASLGNGFVLCVAPGDHLQVELAASGCCSDELGMDGLTGDEALDGERPADAPECPSCEDVDLLVDPVRPDRETVGAPIAPLGPAMTVTVESPRTGTRRCGPSGRLRAEAHLVPLRTIVLRC